MITGGTQGLGFATAALMAARGAAGIVIVGRDRAKAERAAADLSTTACRVVAVSEDLAVQGAADRIIDVTDVEFGRVDHVVNCAAATWRGTVWNSTDTMWDDILALNVRAPARLITRAASLMNRESTPGSIVLVGSVAHHGGATMLYPYSASKHALEGVVRNAGFSLLPHGIRVNLLNPGWMDTPAEHEVQQRFHDAPEDWLTAAEAQQPTGRLLKPDEVARAICFLASDESGMMTGVSLDLDQTFPGTGDLPRPEPVADPAPWESLG